MKNHMKYYHLILLCCVGIGIAYNAKLQLPERLFENVDDTQWEYNDCGKVVFVDRTTIQNSSSIAYYVTYESEYFQKDHTLKVTPSAYQSAKSIKSKGGEICFGVNAGPNDGWKFLFLFLWAVVIVFGFMILRWGRFLLLNKDYEPSLEYSGY